MNSAISGDLLRVTSIPLLEHGSVIFKGVPLDKSSHQLKSAKYFVAVITSLSNLPMNPDTGEHLEPTVGQLWEVEGHRVIKDVEVGTFVMKQHSYKKPKSLLCILPEDGEQVIKFISTNKDFKGIGESKARALWNLAGNDLYGLLRNNTVELRTRFKDVLTDESITSLVEGFSKYKNLGNHKWMSDHKIPTGIQQRLLRHHNDSCVKAIKDNPYRLVAFGLTFKQADKIATEQFNSPLDDPNRLSTSVEMAIRKEIDDGHTYTTREYIKGTVKNLLGSDQLAAQAFMAAHDRVQFIIGKESGYYHPTPQLLMETIVAKRLLSMAKINNLFADDANQAMGNALKDLPYPLLELQNEAVITSLDNSVSCITGGAGTGKTTVLRTVLKSYHEMGFTIHAVALSGRAAQRLHESIGFETSTIAAFLNKEPILPSDSKPKHILVIDEGSMVDLPTMYKLVINISPETRIIFSGDPDQLPPIGCGKVLADVVASGAIANVTLDIVKRQKGSTGIPEYSKKIREGEVPETLSSGAITFHETSKECIAEVCTKLYAESPKNSRIVGSTKIMVAKINSLCQQEVNFDGEVLTFKIDGKKYITSDPEIRKDDSVLFTQNNYQVGVQNGSLGTLIKVHSSDSDATEFGMVELDTKENISVTKPILDSMALGYCVTLHKAQGSQFPRIIVALKKGIVVDRAWLYTAITRAESEVHIVGSEEEFKAITQEPSKSHLRNSHLFNMLKLGRTDI